MARTRKPTADRRTEIARAALRLAAELGPERVTARHLAEAVGISQPAIFRHFATKSEIWTAVAEMVAQRLTGEGMATTDDPADALRAMIRQHLDHIQQTPAIPAILFSRELHVENEAMRAHFDQVMANRRACFATLVNRARSGGQFRADLVAADAAALILAAIQGLAVRWSLENRRFDLPQEGMRLIDGLIDGFCANRA